MEEVKKGSVRGLFGYAPDRFSRNLQEGGELIQLVEKRLVELKFTNFVFENNASGHMMLGIFFVFAEHYSKKLSEDSTRGIKQKTVEGRTCGSKKTGYKKSDDERDYFVPDELHFPLLRQAFLRKIQDDWSDEKIAKEMNKMGWREDDAMSSRKISSRNIWQDTFFYGVWRRDFQDGDTLKIDLRNLEGYDFQPVISEDEFLLLQELLIQRNNKAKEERQTRATKRLDEVTPLEKDIILDADTGKILKFSIPNGHRFRARLETLQTSNPNVILSDIVAPHQIKYSFPKNNVNFDVLDDYLAKQFKKVKITKEDYQSCLYALRLDVDQKFEEKKHKQRAINLLLAKNEREEKSFIRKNMGKDLSEKEQKIYDEDMKKFDSKRRSLWKEKETLSQDIRDEVLEFQAFFKLFTNLPKLWKKASYVQKRKLSELLLLNIKVKDGKPVSMKVKPEFEHMFPENIRGGGSGGS